MLLDTNIVSYFFRHDTRAARYERHLVGQPRYIALVTVAELYQWLFLRPFSEANRQRLIEYIAEHIPIPYDDKLAWTWTELSANCRKAGRTIAMEDSKDRRWSAKLFIFYIDVSHRVLCA